MLEEMVNLIVYGIGNVTPEMIDLGYVTKRNIPTDKGRKFVKAQLDGYCCVPECYEPTIWSCFCRKHGDKYFKSNARGSKLIYDMRDLPDNLVGVVEFVCREGSERGVTINRIKDHRAIKEAINLDLLKNGNGYVQITPKAFGLLK